MGQYDLVPTIVSRFASTTLFLYEILLTADDEIVYVWSSKWSFPKVLYLWVRYSGLINQLFSSIISVFPLSDEFCNRYALYYPTYLLITAASTDALLLLRVLCLVQEKVRLSFMLRCCYGGSYLVLTALLLYNNYEWAKGSYDWVTNLGCVQTLYTLETNFLGAAVLSIATIPVLFLNATILTIVLCAVLPVARRESTKTPLFVALIRDGVMYYAITTCVTLVTTITPLAYYNSPRAWSLAEPWFMTICPIASCRLFLNLRSTMTQRDPVKRAPSPRPPSDIEVGTDEK